MAKTASFQAVPGPLGPIKTHCLPAIGLLCVVGAARGPRLRMRVGERRHRKAPTTASRCPIMKNQNVVALMPTCIRIKPFAPKTTRNIAAAAFPLSYDFASFDFSIYDFRHRASKDQIWQIMSCRKSPVSLVQRKAPKRSPLPPDISQGQTLLDLSVLPAIHAARPIKYNHVQSNPSPRKVGINPVLTREMPPVDI